MRAHDGVVLREMRWWDIEPVLALERELFPEDAWTPGMFWSELAHARGPYATRHYTVAEAPDGTVLYEKTEHYLIDDRWVALPCMIALEFTDDLISHWRAYFDVATWTAQTRPPGRPS